MVEAFHRCLHQREHFLSFHARDPRREAGDSNADAQRCGNQGNTRLNTCHSGDGMTKKSTCYAGGIEIKHCGNGWYGGMTIRSHLLDRTFVFEDMQYDT